MIDEINEERPGRVTEMRDRREVEGLRARVRGRSRAEPGRPSEA